MTATDQVAQAFAEFDAWCREWDPESEMSIEVQASAYQRCCTMEEEIERQRRVIMDQGVKIGLLLVALSEIDDLAVSHTKGAVGKAQKIARQALTSGTKSQSVR